MKKKPNAQLLSLHGLLAIAPLLFVACGGQITPIAPTESTLSPFQPTAGTPSLLPPALNQVPSATRATPMSSLAPPGRAAATPATSIVQFSLMMTDFAFDPSELSVRAGQIVRLQLRNEGAYLHDFVLPEFGVATIVPVGKTALVEFVADKPGSYMFVCLLNDPFSHYDSGMKGTLTVKTSP